jgi:hypothetical protein
MHFKRRYSLTPASTFIRSLSSRASRVPRIGHNGRQCIRAVCRAVGSLESAVFFRHNVS